MSRFRYSPDMLGFLRRGYKRMRLQELTRAFNEAYGLDKSEQQIKCCLSNHGFTSGRPPGTPKGTLRLFTQQQMGFIQAHYGDMGRARVTQALNNAFGTQFTRAQVTAFINNHRLYSARTGHFLPGQTPWNAGMKGWQAGGRSVETQFKPGRPAHEARNYCPIGSLRTSKDGYIERKVTDDPSVVPARRWVGVHRLIWEAAHGPIPGGHVVVFLDADKQNLDQDNLRCVPRGVLATLNKLGLNDTSGEARRAAILTCEVINKTNKIEACA